MDRIEINGVTKMQLPDFLTEQSAGAIRLTDHRIALEHMVHFYNQGYSPEMILGQFPSLSLATGLHRPRVGGTTTGSYGRPLLNLYRTADSGLHRPRVGGTATDSYCREMSTL